MKSASLYSKCLLAGSLLLLGGCATDSSKTAAALPILPTMQYPLEAEARDETIHLRMTSQALSANQVRALDNIVQKTGWAEGNSADVLITTGPGPASVAMGQRVQDYLIGHGVDSRALTLGSVKTQPSDVISLTVTQYRARPITCNQTWENLSRTATNQVYANYGCAVTANMAAQIADPRDMATPQGTTPADAGRKSVILGKYRKGEITSTPKDEQAQSTISQAVK